MMQQQTVRAEHNSKNQVHQQQMQQKNPENATEAAFYEYDDDQCDQTR